MDYRKQQGYLRSSRLRGIFAIAVMLAISAMCVNASGQVASRIVAAFALITVALAGSIYYTPDYLHLTVVPDKKARWAMKIRWRIIVAVLLLGLLLPSTAHGRLMVLLAVVWLLAANLLARKLVPGSYTAAFFWATDIALLAAALLAGSLPLLLGAVLLAAAAHISVVICGERYWLCALVSTVCSAALLYFAAGGHDAPAPSVLPYWTLIALAAFITSWLVDRAEKQNAQNIATALNELIEFTSYTSERIQQLWQTSNQQLARNWERAAIPHDDRERMAEWYRENSELYLFAISAYNLEYKRIKSNLKVTRFARGSCLDYGAGNGEILLELARRGHPVTYFDVEGVTMRFARQRAQQHKLNLQFARTKDELRTAAGQRGFDTIFSFDVLEHLPDLAGELTFLSSLLSRGGVFVFDVPAGSTKAHPMHLNHNLDVLAYLNAKGLKDRRTFSLRMPFRKEEKYVFQA